MRPTPPSLLFLAPALLAMACGAPPAPVASSPAGPGGKAAPVGKRVPSGATLADSRPDPNPIPEGALVVDRKPWDLGYEAGKFGGTLVISAFSDPKTFNWIVSNETSSSDIFKRMMSDLVHVNAFSGEAEPALATSFTVSEDGRSMTLPLRKGLQWSDGEPFDADDVIFTWQAVFDPQVRSPQADSLTVEGKPIGMEKVDAHTVRMTFPQQVAVPERLLSGVYILPEHKLAASLKAGTFTSEWGVGMKAADFVTLGPFKLSAYQPGIKTAMERNPHYWKLDRERRRLPYLDGITVMSVPDWNSERLKYENLESHAVRQCRQEDYADLKKLEAEKDWTVHLLDPSPAINFMWFNQNDASQATLDGKSYMVFPGDVVKEQSRLVEGAERGRVLAAPRKPYVDAVKVKWFRDRRFRKAVSHALNREGMIRSIFYGLGVPLYGGISPGNTLWHNPGIVTHPYDLAKAAQLLDEAGYRDRDGDGTREDAEGHPLEFLLQTNKGNEQREKMGTIIKEDLARLGMNATFRPIDFNSLITKLHSTFDYEACILGLTGDDLDPVEGLNVWKSSGFTHQWYPFQPAPSTEAERRIDEALLTVQTSRDREARRKAFFEVQAIVAEEQFLNTTLCVKLITTARNCVGNFRPAMVEHYSLHNSDLLYFKY